MTVQEVLQEKVNKIDEHSKRSLRDKNYEKVNFNELKCLEDLFQVFLGGKILNANDNFYCFDINKKNNEILCGLFLSDLNDKFEAFEHFDYVLYLPSSILYKKII